MKVRSWLSTCSTTSSTAISSAPSPSPPLSSDTSSLHSNLSLLTLPSVPSLQQLLPSPEPPSSAATSSTLLPARRAAHITSLALHNNLLYAAAGDEITVFETITNALLDTFSAGRSTRTGSVKSIAFSDGKVFTAHQDCGIRVWKINDRKQHKLVATLPTLEDRLRRFVLPQNYVRVRRHRKKLWIHHHDAVSGLAEYQNTVLSISWDRSIKTWQAGDNFRCLASINKAHDDAINAVVVSDDGLVYTGSADRRINVWRMEGRKHRAGPIATLEKHKSAVNALALSSDGSVLFSGSCDRSILVWEREDSANHMAVAGALRGHAKAVLCLINVRDLLMSGSADRTVRIWRRGLDGRYCCLSVLDGHRAPVRSLAATAAAEGGGVRVFSGTFDGEIRLWEVEGASADQY